MAPLASMDAARRQELAAKETALTIFGLRVKAFDARVQGYQARIQAKISELSATSAEIEGQLTAITAFEKQAEAFEEQVRALMQRTETETKRNQGVMEQYAAALKGALFPVEQSALQARYDLAMYEASADDYLADAQLALQARKIDAEYAEQNAKGVLDAYRINQQRLQDVVDAYREFLNAAAEISVDGSAIYAGMAESALSAANGIADVIFTESA